MWVVFDFVHLHQCMYNEFGLTWRLAWLYKRALISVDRPSDLTVTSIINQSAKKTRTHTHTTWDQWETTKKTHISSLKHEGNTNHTPSHNDQIRTASNMTFFFRFVRSERLLRAFFSRPKSNCMRALFFIMLYRFMFRSYAFFSAWSMEMATFSNGNNRWYVIDFCNAM